MDEIVNEIGLLRARIARKEAEIEELKKQKDYSKDELSLSQQFLLELQREKLMWMKREDRKREEDRQLQSQRYSCTAPPPPPPGLPIHAVEQSTAPPPPPPRVAEHNNTAVDVEQQLEDKRRRLDGDHQEIAAQIATDLPALPSSRHIADTEISPHTLLSMDQNDQRISRKHDNINANGDDNDDNRTKRRTADVPKKQLFDNVTKVADILTVIRNHTDDSKIVWQGFDVLTKAFENESVVSVNDAKTLVGVLKKHEDNTKVMQLLQHAYEALTKLIERNNDNIEILLRAEVVDFVLKKFVELCISMPVKLLEITCQLLIMMIQNETFRNLIRTTNAIEPIIHCVYGNGKNRSLKLNVSAVKLLKLLIDNDDTYLKKIVETNGIQSIASSMRKWKSSKFNKRQVGELVEYGVCVLSKMVDGDTEFKVKISELNGIELVLEAMNKHPDVANVQRNGCHALYQLSLNNEVNKKKVAKGIDVVLSAMTKHANNAEVHRHACCVLCNLSSIKESRANINQNAVELMTNAIKNHANNIEVVRHAVDAFAWLSCELDKCAIMYNCGVIELLISAIKTHNNDSDVAYNVCCTFGNLSNKHDASKTKISELNGIELVIEAMKKHPDVVNVQHCGCHALRYFADGNEVNKKKVAKGIECYTKAKDKYSNNAKIQEHASALLSLLNTK